MIGTSWLYDYIQHLQTPLKWLRADQDVTYDVETQIEGVGRVRGKRFTFEDGRHARAFLGIPFARAGVDEHRFEKPQPVEPWSEVRDCTHFGPRSLQVDLPHEWFLTPVAQDEAGCLNLNIFVPEVETLPPEGLPVMVFLHGGGFMIHSSANYGDKQICRNLCRKGVIVVAIQYRLGVLGFFSLGTDECPGNFGLWDQREAFVWIKAHIRDFGGDPSNITAFGQSAGAASVDLLSLSPKCEGLINRVILMGGNAASDWAIVESKRTIKAGIAVARKHGWTGDDNDHQGLLQFLRRLPAGKCRAAIFGKSLFNRSKKGLDLCPVIDGDFLPEPVVELRKKAKTVRAIIGTCDYEALLFVVLGRAQYDLMSFEKQIKIHIPDCVPNAAALRDEGRDLYMNGIDRTDKIEVARAFLQAMLQCTHRYTEEMTKAGHTVYLYNLTYCDPSAYGWLFWRVPLLGATHCHDLRYLFGKGLFAKFKATPNDLRLLQHMTTMFTNFAKTGNPNYENSELWKPATLENSYLHLRIDVDLAYIDNYQGRRSEFWRRLDDHKIAGSLDQGPAAID